MALPTQMNEDERGILALNGLTGGIIATVLLLSILGVLTYFAIVTQQANATKTYTVNQDLNALKFNSSDNHKMWIDKK